LDNPLGENFVKDKYILEVHHFKTTKFISAEEQNIIKIAFITDVKKLSTGCLTRTVLSNFLIT